MINVALKFFYRTHRYLLNYIYQPLNNIYVYIYYYFIVF